MSSSARSFGTHTFLDYVRHPVRLANALFGPSRSERERATRYNAEVLRGGRDLSMTGIRFDGRRAFTGTLTLRSAGGFEFNTRRRTHSGRDIVADRSMVLSAREVDPPAGSAGRVKPVFGFCELRLTDSTIVLAVPQLDRRTVVAFCSGDVD